MNESATPQPADAPTVPAWEQDIITKCEEAGLQVMAGILIVLHEREIVSRDVLDALTADDIDAFYEGYVSRAINDMERSLLGDFN